MLIDKILTEDYIEVQRSALGEYEAFTLVKGIPVLSPKLNPDLPRSKGWPRWSRKSRTIADRRNRRGFVQSIEQ